MFRFGSSTPRKKKNSSDTVHDLEVRESLHSNDSNDEPLAITILEVPELRDEDETLGNVASDVFVTPYNKRLPAWRKVKEKDPNQEKWNNRFEFISACFGFIIGTYGLITLPLDAVLDGAASFLIAFFILGVLLGIPLLFFEVAIGQFSGHGPAKVFDIIPIAIGLGYAIVFEGVYKTCSEIVDAAQYGYVLFDSFRSALIWENETTEFAAKNLIFYFNTTVLNKDPSTDELGSLIWPLVGCLAFSWFLILLLIWRPINVLGKIMSVLVPITVLLYLSLFIAILTQKGATDGLVYFLTPGNELGNFKLWNKAAVSLMKMMGFGYGINILFGSYTRFQSPAHIDCLIVSLVAMLTFLLACLFLFAGIGVLAKSTGNDVDVVKMWMKTNKYFWGNDYVLFSIVLNELPNPVVWCGIFYFVAFSQTITTITAHTSLISRSLYSYYPLLRLHPLLTSIGIVIPLFLLGLPFVTQNGTGPLNSMPHLVVVQFIIVILNMFAFVFCYGMKRLRNDLDFMLQYNPNLFYRISWILTPFYLFGTLCYHLVKLHTFIDPYLMEKQWRYVMWLLSFGVVLCPIPLCALFAIVKFYRQRDLRGAFRPHSEEEVLARENMAASNVRGGLKMFKHGSDSSSRGSGSINSSSVDTGRHSTSTILPSTMNLVGRRGGSSDSAGASSSDRVKSSSSSLGRRPPPGVNVYAVTSSSGRFKSSSNFPGMRLPPGVSVDAITSSMKRYNLEMQRGLPHLYSPARERRRARDNLFH